MTSGDRTLHVTYGDALAQLLRAHAPDGEVLVVRDALRGGPLAPSPTESMDAFVAVRARHLAQEHGADEQAAAQELAQAWQRIQQHGGDVALHVDVQPCVDCATFLACALDALHRAGRGVSEADTGVAVVRGADPADAVQLTPEGLAAGAGLWRMLSGGDHDGLVLAAADLEGLGGIGGYPELAGLLARRGEDDVPLSELHL